MRGCRNIVTMKSQHQEQNRKPFDSFASRLRFVREKRGVSLGALANGKPSTAKSWESGVNPRPDQWEGIASKLGVSVSFLFLGHPKTPEDYAFVAKYNDEIATFDALDGSRPAILVRAADGVDPAHSGRAEDIQDRLLREFALLVDAADGDVARLGWISEQMRQHLAEPTHWGMPERIAQRVAERMARERAEKDKSAPERKAQ